MVSLKDMAQDARKRNISKSSKEPPKPKPVFKSSELVQESEDEAPSASDSDSDHESIDSKQQNITSKLNGRLPAPDGSSSESESESEQETTSSEEDEESNTVAKETPLLPEPQRKPAPEAVTKSVSSRAPSEYKPPSGFQTEPLEGNLAASEILSSRNLVGKQIWYFTAPASIDISAMEEMSLLDMKEGKAVLKHNGDEYQFAVETTKNQAFTNIMVPNGSDKGYQIASKAIDQILHLQQKVNLPGINGTNSTVASPIKKAPRPQPKGLRMRFHPIGFDTENPEIIGSGSSSIDGNESDEEMEMAPKVFQRPQVSKVDESSSDGEQNDNPIVPSKFTTKIEREKHSKPKASTQDSQSSKKRRHEDGKVKKPKKRLLSPTNNISSRELKRMKKNQTEQPTEPEKAPVQTESSVPPPRPKTLKPSSKLDRSEHPHKLRYSPQLLLPSENDVDYNGATKKARPANGSDRTPLKPVLDLESSLKNLTSATNPSPTAEERRKKVKKLKNKDLGHHSQTGSGN